MEIEVDAHSPTPHYEQIRSQITRLVLSGALPEGTRLPPIRQLAGHLGLSNGAVARAYRELEREGTVLTAGKKGTTVAPGANRTASGEQHRDRERALAEAASTFAITANRMGYTLTDAVAALRKAMTPPSSSEP